MGGASYLGPSYGGGNEDIGNLLPKIPCSHWYTQCPQPCSRPPPIHTSTGDSQTLTGKSGSVSHGVTTPCSWVLVHTRLPLCPPRVYFLLLCKLWQLYIGVSGNLLQEGVWLTQVCCTQSPCPCGSPLLTCTSAGDAQTQFCPSLCGAPGPQCTQGLPKPSELLWQECKFATPTVLLGLLLCPLVWGISSQPLHHLPSYWGFSDLGRGVSPYRPLATGLHSRHLTKFH